MNTPPIRARFYIDAFNFYYGSLKMEQAGLPVLGVRWLNLQTFSMQLLPLSDVFDVDAIYYFTARVNSSDPAPNSQTRQDAYLNALQHACPLVSQILGKYKTVTVRGRPRDAAIRATHPTLKVRKPEEKGSDVNLAIQMVRDAALNEVDALFVISDDSDIARALNIVRHEMNKKVFYCSSANRFPNPELVRQANATIRIKSSTIKANQLPNTIQNTKLTKPITW